VHGRGCGCGRGRERGHAYMSVCVFGVCARERGVIVVSIVFGGRSLYCLHFGISQLMGPEACFGIFVRV